jgi:hypothetical protein
MALAETLGNPETEKRLGRLVAALDRLAAGKPPYRRTMPQARAHYPASTAILEVLSQAGVPMRVPEIHAAVESKLGSSVPRATIKSFLSYNASGKAPRLERLSRGRYRLSTLPSEPEFGR